MKGMTASIWPGPGTRNTALEFREGPRDALRRTALDDIYTSAADRGADEIKKSGRIDRKSVV